MGLLLHPAAHARCRTSRTLGAFRACYCWAIVTTLGVISDTHGLLRPEARAALRSVDRIIHAGDVDEPVVLQMLVTLAPLTVVRGNMDRGGWARRLPEATTLEVAGVAIHVVHDLGSMTVDLAAGGIAVVVHGHTHRPRNEVVGSVLYFNPGSAGPQRYGCPVTLGKLHIAPDGVRGEIISLG
jgi:putative phosphoesterase